MAVIGNPELIATPAPGVLRYGLFSAATVLDNLETRGIASGFQFASEDCGVSRAYDANCPPTTEKVFDEGMAYVEATPYIVYATQKCGTVGRSPAEVEASVRRKLAASEQHTVEQQLWGATAVPSDPNLVGAIGVTSVVPVGAGAGAAIAALEESFYSEYGYLGMIHVNMQAYAAARYAGLVEHQGSRLVTPVGSTWSFGTGYNITGPAQDAPDAGTVWAFMTPPVVVRRSTTVVVDVVATMDRTNNQYMALAERVYAHAWTCDVVHAVQIPLDAPAVVTTAAAP